MLVFCAMAPDLDLVLRLFDGVNHHRGASHSFGAAVAVGLLAMSLARLGFSMPSAATMSAAWASHVVLDYLGLDTSPPAGEMALWPFSQAFYISPVPIFLDVPRALTLAAVKHNALAVLIEVVILLPIAALCWRRSPSCRS